MYPILLASILGLAIIIEKLCGLYSIRLNVQKFSKEVFALLAIIDFELGFAEFEGREPKMPVLGCPGCNRESQEFTGLKSPPEGR